VLEEHGTFVEIDSILRHKVSDALTCCKDKVAEEYQGMFEALKRRSLADSMTSSAQQALRRTMELYSSTTRFALACNISSKIIEPIQSRCAILRFTKLKDMQILKRLKEVLSRERITGYTNDGLKALLFTAEGDMRHALNNLQSTVAGFGQVTEENVYKVVDKPHPVLMLKMIMACSKGNIIEALQMLDGIWSEGYSAIDIIGTLFRVTKTADLHPKILLEFIKEIGFTHMRISEGLDSKLQITGLLSRICEKATKIRVS